MKRIPKQPKEPAHEQAESGTGPAQPARPHSSPPHSSQPAGYEHHAIGQGGQPGRGRTPPVPPGPAPRNRPNSPARTRRGR